VGTADFKLAAEVKDHAVPATNAPSHQPMIQGMRC